MALEQPKKPVGGAFGQFANEKRPEFLKALAGQKASEVSKMAGAKWKELSEADRAPYVQKYEAAKAQYEKDMEVFLAAGGEKSKGSRALRSEKRKAKEGKSSKKDKDPNKPKKPVGGAYGVFQNEHRARIVASLPKDHKITDVAKAAGAEWKALSDTDKKPYEEKYAAKKEEYNKAMEGYVPPVVEKTEEETPEKKPTRQEKKQAALEKNLKRAKPDNDSSTPAKQAKRGRKAVTTPPKEVEIDATVLKEVETLNYLSQFKNLAARSDVKSSGKSHKDMLDALKSSEGLVNKGKSLLLAGA